MNSISHPDCSRRQFLAQATLGLAAVSTLSRAVAQGSTASSRLRLGLIGCGGRGQWIARLFQEHGGYEIAGAADYFQARVQEAASKFDLTPGQAFTGLKCAEKMIARGGLDAVAIISPPYFHPEQARAAVNAGLHVYLAKPVAVDVPGCQSISDTGVMARKKGLVFLVDFQTRANEFFREAIRRVHAGAIGDICFGESSYQAERLKIKTTPGTPEARLQNWVFDQALSGDIIVEQNIHTLGQPITDHNPPAELNHYVEAQTGGHGARQILVRWFASVSSCPPSVPSVTQGLGPTNRREHERFGSIVAYRGR